MPLEFARLRASEIATFCREVYGSIFNPPPPPEVWPVIPAHLAVYCESCGNISVSRSRCIACPAPAASLSNLGFILQLCAATPGEYYRPRPPVEEQSASTIIQRRIDSEVSGSRFE